MHSSGVGTGIDWLELDLYEPNALRQIRDAAPMPIASLESLIGRKAFRPYLEAGSVDVAIIDTLWNGVAESVKIANLCDSYEVNCAAHNYHGWLGTVSRSKGRDTSRKSSFHTSIAPLLVRDLQCF